MKHTYKIEGMTCGNCKATIEKTLNELQNVEAVTVNLEKGEATIAMSRHIDTAELQEVLPSKYTILEKKHENVPPSSSMSSFEVEQGQSKLQQLKPLLLIIFYITVAGVLLHYKSWSWNGFMLDSLYGLVLHRV